MTRRDTEADLGRYPCPRCGGGHETLEELRSCQPATDDQLALDRAEIDETRET